MASCTGPAEPLCSWLHTHLRREGLSQLLQQAGYRCHRPALTSSLCTSAGRMDLARQSNVYILLYIALYILLYIAIYIAVCRSIVLASSTC